VILVDTSVWVDHLRSGDSDLAVLLDLGRVVIHPFVLGELSLGNLRQRSVVLGSLAGLPGMTVASDAEVLSFVESAKLYGLGIGYIDAHLLAAARLTPGVSIWTRDKRLVAAAEAIGLASTYAR
jgi:predicted nucleic acid-binding protein